VLEQRDRVPGVSFAQRNLRAQRLPEGLNRDPTGLGHERE
jgi:hypothetical protein